ncbi:MAG TPA: hypothetical protein VKD72_16380 [Gemmataceae bacterium]|nr:hypothetical protein [Gemmataceae bacterium]
MDCKTARHLLEFSRPRLNELEGCDQDALNGHLAVCPDCDAMARAEREADEHLGRIIREVPVPQGLHERLLRRLRDEREAWYRRWLARGLRVVAIAAAVLLIAWFGLINWRKHNLPRPDGEDLAKAAQGRRVNLEMAMEWFREHGFSVAPPDEFKEENLFSYHLADLPGISDLPGIRKKLPCLLFVRTDNQGRQSQVALVYILSDKQFDLSAVPAQTDWGSGSPYKSLVWHRTPNFAYVIIYSGDLKEFVVNKDPPQS